MEQYIPKSTLVAEIERIENETNYEPFTDEVFGKRIVCKDIKDFINTLEVKEVDFEKDIKQIFSLYYEGIKYYEDVIRKEREEKGGSDLAIKIMDRVVDARELGIQYVIDKLKA